MEMLTVAEVAKKLKTSRATVRRYIRRGLLVAYKLGGGKDWRIPEKAVDDFIQQGLLVSQLRKGDR